MEEIMEMLKDYSKILIIGCGTCATECQTGGEDQVKEMAEKLRETGKKIVATIVPEATCDMRITRLELNKVKDAVNEADAILVMACGAGVQAVYDLTEKICVPALNTVFVGVTERIGRFYERCRACGDCILYETGGICPVARCPKGLMNGPCGGQANGKCEVGNWEYDCAWVKIYEALKKQGRLDLLLKVRMPKDYSKISIHRQVVWR